MRKILLSSLLFLFFQLALIIFPLHTIQADPYDCLHYGTKQCISLHVSAKCSSGKPIVTLTWNNPHNDLSFNIVYAHDGHWYMKPIKTKVLSTTIPPYGAYKDGGSASSVDIGFKATGGGFSAKITGGYPSYMGGPGLTTGYSTPDSTVTMPTCTAPTPTPTKIPTSAPKLSPTPTPGIHGHLDASTCTTGIQGWACQDGYDTKSNRIDIYKNGPYPTGTYIGSTIANVQREDALKSYCGGTSNHGFVFSSSQLAHDNTPHNYYAYAIDLSGKNKNSLLYKSPVSISCPMQTYISIAIQLPGIGAGGNLSPKHTTRTLHVSLYKSTVDPSQPNVSPIFTSKTIVVTYDRNTGYFVNNKVLIGNIATGDYQLLIKTPGYLRKEWSGPDTTAKTIHLTGNAINAIPYNTLVPGDTSPIYNVMDASDFYAIVGCYKDKADSSTCAAGKVITDLNDNGVIDGIDLNLWLSGFQSLQTNNNPQGNGDGVTGD